MKKSISLPFLLSLSILLLSSGYSHANTQEGQLRAAVIGGILRYASWEQPNTRVICALGQPMSAPSLTQAAHRIRINNEPASVLQIDTHHDVENCQVLVIGTTSQPTHKALGPLLAHNQLLSICDGCSSPELPTSITLVRIKNKIAFNVDLNRTKNAGIKFSSALLELANQLEGYN